jgi:integrase
MLLLLYYTGLRRGEAIGLQWHDIDFQKSTLTVRRDFDFKTMELGKPKTKAALRTLPIPLELLLELDRVRGIGEAVIFPGIVQSAGNKLQAYRNEWESLRAALYAADKTIEAKGKKSILTAHYYRHNYASILYNGGIDVLTAQKWLGHADAKTTLSIYAHLSKEYELQNAEKLNAVFSKVIKKLPSTK